MELLKDRIRKDGTIHDGNILTVDRFLNHQIDIPFLKELAKEFQKRFEGVEINKILTLEASGIPIACMVAEVFNLPLVFAKKTKTRNISGDVYSTQVESYTNGRIYNIFISREFLNRNDKVLFIDDFLANGKALEGLFCLAEKAGASIAGAGVVIEKGFQMGGDIIRSKGILLESLAIVERMNSKNDTIVFRE